MRTCPWFVATFMTLTVIVVQVKADEPVTQPTFLDGSWSSEVDFSWGGNLTIHTKNVSAHSLVGDIDFGGSACPGFYPFTGTRNMDGSLKLTTDLGGRCGVVTVTLKKADNKWRGRYVADYPDQGTVELSPR